MQKNQVKKHLTGLGHLQPCSLSGYKPISFPTEGQRPKTESCTSRTIIVRVDTILTEVKSNLF